MNPIPVRSSLLALLLAAASLTASAEAQRYLVQDVVNVQIIGALRQDRLSSTMDGIGDFNGDGIDDFAVSTDQFIEEPRRNYVYVIHGATDLPKVMDFLSPPAKMLRIENPYMMRASGLGDFNGDGLSDLAVSLNTTNIGDVASGGEVLILYGGQITEGSVKLEDDLPGVRVQGHLNGERLGSALSRAGDVNGDGYADLLIYGLANRNQAIGEAVIVYGGTDVPNVLSTGDLGDHGTILKSAFSYDRFGLTMACVGDVNGDGFDDLLIGADADDDKPDRAYLIYGGTDLPPVIEASSLGKYGMVIEGGSNSNLGAFVAGAGDVNRDGFNDLLLSRFLVSAGGLSDAGITYIVFGGRNLPGTIDVRSLGSRGITISGAEEGEALGALLAGPGDWDGDQYPEIAIGTSALRHEIYLMKGGPAYSAAKTIRVDQLEKAVLYYYDPLGSSFPRHFRFIGDVNGDGYDDLAAGNWFYNYSSDGTFRSSAGAVYIFYGGQFFPTATPTETPTITPTPTITATPTPSNTPRDPEFFSGWMLRGNGEISVTPERE